MGAKANTKKSKAKSTRRASPVRRVKASNLRTPAEWLVEALTGGEAMTKVNVNERTALSASAVFACVRAIAEDVAKVGLVLKRINRETGVSVEAFDHPLYDQLRQTPNPDMTSLSYRRTVTASALLWGNGYAEIVRDGGGGVRQQLPIHPSRVTPEYDDLRRLQYRVINDDGKMVVIPQANMLHVRGFGHGVVGYSILKLGREAIGLMIAAERFAATFFGSGTRLSGVLTHPNHLGEDAARVLRESWEKMHSGADNQNKVAILEEGLEFKPMSVPPEEAQMLETRVMSVAEACRFFRVPPHKVFELTRATFSNIEHQSLEYVGDSLYTWFVEWEQEIKRKLIRTSEKDLYAEHKYQTLLMGDMAARSTRQREMFNVGAMSINEIRRENGMNPIGKEGDIRWVNGAMVPIEIAKNGPQKAQPTPAEQPERENAPPAPDDSMERRVRKVAAIVPYYEDLLSASLSCVLSYEANHITAAAKRRGFAEWSQKFYADNSEHVRARIGGIIDAFCAAAWSILSDSPFADEHKAAACDATKAIAARHVERSIAEMREPSIVREWAAVRSPDEARSEASKLYEFIINLAGAQQ